MLEHKIFALHHVTKHNQLPLVSACLRNWHQDTVNEPTLQRRSQRLRSPKFLTLLAQASVPQDIAAHVKRVYHALEDLSPAVLAVAAAMLGKPEQTAQQVHTDILRAPERGDSDADLRAAVHRGVQFGDVAETLTSCTRILATGSVARDTRGYKGRGATPPGDAPRRS